MVYVDLESGTVLNGPVIDLGDVSEDLTDAELVKLAEQKAER